MKDFEKSMDTKNLTLVGAPVFTCKEKIKGQEREAKLCESIEEAICRSGLKSGMTISFHHAFRGGDLIINTVLDIIARMGFKDLTLASSSLANSLSPNIVFTPVWASSKLPSIPTTYVLSPFWVTICFSRIGLTPCFG